MAKQKMNFCVAFSLCLFLLLGFGASDESQNSDSTQISIQALESQMSLILKRLESVEKGKEELEKFNAELKKQVNSLSEKLSGVESKISEDGGLWLLTPPLRGPPGKPGVKGEIGLEGPKGKDGEHGQPGPKGERGFSALQPITSCSLAMEAFSSPRSQKQTIYPHGNSKSLEVLCDFDMDGGGWTIIQKRTSGPKEEFYQNWDEYAEGFGSLSGNFWLGLENIHSLTKNGDQELRIDLEDFNGNKAYAKYSRFSISSASDSYRLAIGGYFSSSTAGDSMTGSWNINGAKFSTKDKDNDDGDRNCAQGRHGAWWYKNVELHCSHSNLNGWYFQSGESFGPGDGLVWESWRGAFTPLKTVHMKIRKRN